MWMREWWLALLRWGSVCWFGVRKYCPYRCRILFTVCVPDRGTRQKTFACLCLCVTAAPAT